LRGGEGGQEWLERVPQAYDTHPWHASSDRTPSRGIPPLFKADAVNIAVSASKDGKLRVVYAGWDDARSS